MRLAVAALLVFLTVRVFWTAADTEAGLSFLGHQWKRATVGWVVETDPITARPATEQARFWLAEIDRVLKEAEQEDPQTRAMLTMGAALCLDQLQIDKSVPQQQYLSTSLPRWFGRQYRHPIGGAMFDEATELQEQVRVRILELANQAVALDPENPVWHRPRAMFAIREGDDLNWREIIDTALAADPENALYDFWLAENLLRDALSPISANMEVTVLNQALVDEALQATARGIAKGECRLGAAADPALFEFLERSSLPRFAFREYTEFPPQVVEQRENLRLLNSRLYRLVTYARTHDDDPRHGFNLELSKIRVSATFSRYDPKNLSRDAARLQRAMELVPAENGEAFFSQEEIAEVAALVDQFALASAVKTEAQIRHDAKFDSFAAHEKTVFSGGDVADLYAILAPDSIGMLVVLALAVFVVSRWPKTTAERGWQTLLACRLPAQVAYLGLALLVAFLGFGVMPAWAGEITSSEAFAFAAVATPMLGMIGFMWLIWRRGFRFRLSRLLIVLALAPIAFMGFFHLLLSFSNGGLAALWDIRAISLGGVSPQSLVAKLDVGASDWLLPITQWILFNGPVWTALILLGILALAYYGAVESASRRRDSNEGQVSEDQEESATQSAGTQAAKKQASENRRRTTLLVHVQRIARIWCRGLLLMALLFYIAYAWLVPDLLVAQDFHFQLALRPARNPAQIEAELADIRSEIMADAQSMAGIRQQADAIIQANAAQ